MIRVGDRVRWVSYDQTTVFRGTVEAVAYVNRLLRAEIRCSDRSPTKTVLLSRLILEDPQVWDRPVSPADVIEVRDRNGVVWNRHAEYEGLWVVGEFSLTWYELLRYAPLNKVR